jgi:outer membrane lipoprotein-sorting protein
MPSDERGHEDLLRRYWQAVAEDAGAEPPEGLDPLAAEMVRGLRSLRAPEPGPAFVARLGERLKEETARRAAPPTIAPAAIALSVRSVPRPLPIAARRRPALAGLATAAAVVLAVIALQVWSSTRPVSATAILQKAEATASGPARFRSFVITEVSEQYPAALAGSEDLVRSEITRWYETPGRWRREVTSTVLAPDGEVKSRGGLVSVSDGSTVWIHRLRDNTVIVRPPGSGGADELGPFPEVTGGLSGLLSQAGACYTPRVVGGDTIAGRSTHVIALGRSRCAPGAEAGAGTELVEWTVWVDKETFLILKSVQEVDGAVVATTTVTSIEYNTPLEASRFDFTPPPGARMRDQRQ